MQRIRQRLDAVFEDAMFHKRCASNPAADIKRKMRETQGKRDRGEFAALPSKEAPEFMRRLREAQGVAARCLEFAVLTASRTSDALYAEWSDDAALWVVPKERMKADEPHTAYLSPRAVGILQAQRTIDSTYVFPSTMAEGKPMSNMAMLAVLDRMGARGRTTVHGLCRATFSMWANDTNAARSDVIEVCLAHSESDRVRSAYDRAQFMHERRELMNAWCKYLAEPKSAQVLPLRAA